jgi:hypothetical protein
VEVVRPILAAASLVTALGLICEIFVPGSGRMIDIGAAVFGAATWVVPLLLMARYWNHKPKSSLASVGSMIGLFVVAACLSVIAISLALLTLVFARDANWAWPTLLAIAAFWVSGVIALNIGSRGSRKAREVPK